MTRRARLVASTIAVALAAVTFPASAATQTGAPPQQGPASSAPPQPAATALLVGRVVDAVSRKPVTGVTVTLRGLQRGRPDEPIVQPMRVIVDSTGGFVFANLRPGEYGLTAVKLGYVEGELGKLRPAGGATTIKLAEGERVGDLTVRMWRQAAIAGAVLDEANEPVVGVTVRTFERTFTLGRWMLVARGTATTDDRGVFRLGGLAPGEFVVGITSTQLSLSSVVSDDYFRQVDAGVRAADSSSDLRSIVNAVAVPAPRGDRESMTIGGSVVQGGVRAIAKPREVSDGAFAIYPSVFFPDAPTTALAGAVTLAAGEVRTGIDLHVRPVRTVAVTGRLTWSEGPAGLIMLRLVPKAAEEATTDAVLDAAATVTDASGNFTFPAVAPGVYMLRGSKQPPLPTRPPAVTQPISWLAETISVADKDLDLAFSLTPGFRVAGTFVFEGQKPRPTPEQMTQLSVTIEAVDALQRGWQTARSNVGGAFATVGVPAGRHLVRAGGGSGIGWPLKSITWQGRDITDVPVEIKSDVADLLITLVDQPAGVGGTVSSGDAPVVESSVLLFPVDPASWVDVGSAPPRFKTVRPDSTGAYTIPNVLPGDYFLAAIAEEAFPGWDPAVLERLGHVAARVRVEVGQKVTQNLKVGPIK